MDMATVGYARVSSTQQDHTSQQEKLKAAGATKIFNEKRSGIDGQRPELQRCIDYVREGDTLLVTKIDRLARSTTDLYRIVSELTEKGVAFRVLDDASVDTTTRTGKLVLGLLAIIAEFENDIRRERQMEGVARAKAEGRTGGRPTKITDQVRREILKHDAAGLSRRAIAAEIGVSKSLVQKVLATVAS
jgi:DNA invertase Pin-like site-specific DNA recombinase